MDYKKWNALLIWGSIVFHSGLVNGVSVGVYWELIAFWRSCFSTVDMSKKVTTVPSASLCTCFIRYRRSVLMQFNDSGCRWKGRKVKQKKICILTWRITCCILTRHAAWNAAYFSVSLCKFLQIPLYFCNTNLERKCSSPQVVKSFSKINSFTRIFFSWIGLVGCFVDFWLLYFFGGGDGRCLVILNSKGL